MIVNCLWMTTQSYGISRLLLIFNAMSILNLLLSIIINFASWPPETGIIALKIVNLLIKLLIAFLGRKTIQFNTKLNKISVVKY